MCGIVVIERGYHQHHAGVECAHPGESGKGIAFVVDVTEKLRGRGHEQMGVVGIKGDLVEVAARLSNEAKLVRGSGVVDEGSESAEAIGGVVNHRRGGRL